MISAENKYIIRVDENNCITHILDTFDYKPNDIELTEEEYHQAQSYVRFDPETRKFSDPIVSNSVTLEQLKSNRIAESKQTLATWLEENPMESEIHNPDGECYTVTQEKQAQLTQMLMLYSVAVQAGGEMQLTWNCTGGVCEEWTYEQLSTLSIQIAGYVLPRVKKQQHYEVEINKCETIEEVEAIEIEYDTI